MQTNLFDSELLTRQIVEHGSFTRVYHGPYDTFAREEVPTEYPLDMDLSDAENLARWIVEDVSSFARAKNIQNIRKVLISCKPGKILHATILHG